LLLNCALAAPIAVGIAWMTRELGGRPAEGLAAASLFAIWPTQVYAATHAQAVVLITLCAVWMIALFLTASRDGNPRAWVAFSLAASVGVLTEPSLLPITALSGLWMLLSASIAARRRMANAAILIGTGLLLLGPWTLRNWMVHGAFVPMKSTFWVNVWKGANDHATGTDRMAMPEDHRQQLEAQLHSLRDASLRSDAADHRHQYDGLTPAQLRELWGKTEIERERIFRRYATEWIAAHPRRFAELCLARLGKSLWVDWDNPKSHNFVYLASRAALLLLSAPGLVLTALRGWRLLYPLLFAGSCLTLYTLTLTAARFAIPLEPFQLVLSAVTIIWIAERVWPSRAVPADR
jgi:hypothetical protein